MNFLLGILIILICAVIQCAMVAALGISVRTFRASKHFRSGFIHETALLSSIVVALVCGMFLQVSIWAAVFVATGEVEDASRAIYFSLVNFTTLGYGDITLSEERAILGAMEAASGILMLGLSTAFLFYVLSFSARERAISIGDDTHVN
jgi:hypothetical protein